ncbi:MAG: TraC family protein, partial [Planctomycetaceae bacterium]|nr:TraC family protein [Planctomycetaceae bacterium]
NWCALRKRDGASLAAGLPYDSCDPDGGVFLGKDASLGMAWLLGTVDAETRSPVELDALSQRFAELVKHVPSGAVVQFAVLSDRELEEELAPWTEEGDGNASAGERAANLLVASHARLLSRLSVQDEGRTFQARFVRLYFTVRVFPDLGKSPAAVAEAYRREKARLLETAATIEGFFTQIQLRFRRLGADGLKALLYRLLNPGRWKTVPARPYRESEALRHQIIRSAATHHFGTGEITLGGVIHRVLSVVDLPQETAPGMLSSPRAGLSSILDLVPDCLLLYNVEILDDYEAKRTLERKYAFAWNQLRTRTKVNIVAIEQDANGALGELLAGRRLVRLRLHVVVWGESPAEAAFRSTTAKRSLQDAGLEVAEEDALALSLFLQSLPLSYDPAFDRGLKRSRSIVSTNLADLLPVYGPYRGTATPEVLLQNRRGEPIAFSLFDSQVAPHGIVTGTSGAGKSFFTNYFAASVRRSGSPVFILDRGNSYRKLCEVLGGRYVSFDPDRPVRINPIGLAQSFDKERLLFAKDTIAEMCAQGEEAVRKEERTVLENAIQRAVERKKYGEVFLSDVYAALLEEAKTGPPSLRRDLDRLTLALKPFVGTGAYAGFFDGPSEVEFGSGFVVFELGDIALRKEIAPVLLMAILYNIADFCSRPENLARKKYLILDEAWTLLESPATSRFIVNALKTYRKLGTSAVMVTQQVADFDGRAGAAILANAPNRVFLRQTPETLLAMERHLSLSREKKAAIASLRTVKGKFSEMFLSLGEESAGVARLIPDPYFYLLATSDAQENGRLEALRRTKEQEGEARPLLAALRELAGGAVEELVKPILTN